jgi:olefin beta-lactone synthetase
MFSLDNDKLLKLVPIGGWLFILYGVIWPIQNNVVYILWLIDIFLSVVVHSLQLFVTIPLGKKLNMSTFTVVLNTLVFGATWWKPLNKKS